MKSGTSEKLKFKQLQRRFKLAKWQARGLLDTLWDFTKTNAPNGDIGKFTNEEIAIGLDWEGDPDELINGLIATKWVNETSGVRLFVHDWHEHCEDSVHLALARKKEFFANGVTPSVTRLSKEEREKIQAAYEAKKQESLPSTQETHKSTPPDPAIPDQTQPSQALPNPAIPSPARKSPGGAGVFSKLDSGVLEDSGRFLKWIEFVASQPKPLFNSSEHSRLMVFAAWERAKQFGEPPLRLFKHIVSKDSKAGWKLITQEFEERARNRLNDHNKGTRKCISGGEEHLETLREVMDKKRKELGIA